MGEMLDSVSADGFSIQEMLSWLYVRAMEWANGDKFYIHVGEDEDVLSKDQLDEARFDSARISTIPINQYNRI